MEQLKSLNIIDRIIFKVKDTLGALEELGVMSCAICDDKGWYYCDLNNDAECDLVEVEHIHMCFRCKANASG